MQKSTLILCIYYLPSSLGLLHRGARVGATDARRGGGLSARVGRDQSARRQVPETVAQLGASGPFLINYGLYAPLRIRQTDSHPNAGIFKSAPSISYSGSNMPKNGFQTRD